MLPDDPTPNGRWPTTAITVLWAFAVALIARLLHHHDLVRIGRRKMLSWALVWELPAAAFSAVVGAGAAEAIGLTGLAVYSVVGIAAWIGPKGIEDVLSRWLDKHYPDHSGDNQRDE